MNKTIISILMFLSLALIQCADKNVKKEKNTDKKTSAKKIDKPIKIEQGVDVKLEAAKDKIVGQWKMIKSSEFYSKWKLGTPAMLEFQENGDYSFNITLQGKGKGKGKLMYKGKYELKEDNGLIFVNFSRTHRGFENDWKSAPAKEIGIVRFLDKKMQTAIINIVNPAWHKPSLDKERNNLWTKIDKKDK